MTVPALQIGERAPDFVLPGESGERLRFYAHAGGRPTALFFDAGGAGDDAADAAAGDVAAELAGLLAGREDVAMCVVLPRHELALPGVPTWVDETGLLRQRYSVPATGPAAVVLDPNLRVAAVATGGTDLAARIAALLDSLRLRAPAVRVTAQAPVLLVPGALDAAHRERLIERWHEAGAVETGVEQSAAGGRREALDPAVKVRRDHTVADPAVLRELSATVGRAVMPEVQKAFAFRATRFEGFKIACYDATTGGYFRAHRDNLTPATAHRVFALTLNLNDDYDGGELRFPEYGNQLYRPDAGAALVFSGSHLHEVLDVTRGRRFVLLSFLYGEPPAASVAGG
jgi:predicted 2-oxoglutarate/Fe(II)-dependent dioxygenase YbiX